MRRFVLWSLLVSAIAGVLGTLAWSRIRPAPPAAERNPLPLQGPAPSFSLTDQTGQDFNTRGLEGRVWIADFIFTSCAGTCPGMSTQMESLQKRLPPEVLLVSFSVDPKRDTPPVLA